MAGPKLTTVNGSGGRGKGNSNSTVVGSRGAGPGGKTPKYSQMVGKKFSLNAAVAGTNSMMAAKAAQGRKMKPKGMMQSKTMSTNRMGRMNAKACSDPMMVPAVLSKNKRTNAFKKM